MKVVQREESLGFHIKQLRNYLILWLSQSLSTLGSSMTSYALMIWTYQQKQSTLGVAMLAVCTYLPSILVSIFAGTFVDRHNKKRIVLVCDSIAVAGTITLWGLMHFGRLEVVFIYGINMIISMMNAFQTPADQVITTSIVPKEYYVKIGGLQSISGSIIGILTPALAMAIISFVGIDAIFIIDVATFLFAVISLLYLVHIPAHVGKKEKGHYEVPFFQDCMEGFRFLKNHKPILLLILYFTAINLVAYIGGGGITTTVTSMVLLRIPDGQMVLGAISSAVAAGTLVGGFLVTLMKTPKKRTAVIFISCGISFFLCDLSMALSILPVVWIVANFIGNIPLAFLNANQSAIMRTEVPIEMQGRVFSSRDMLQYCSIPISYFLGGYLADYVFEPLMANNQLMRNIFGSFITLGQGSGIAVMFVFTGITGALISAAGYFNKKIRTLD